MNKVKAPFTRAQVRNLNTYQQLGKGHPFTCCSHEGCRRSEQKNDGELIATKKGWVCPCGRYTQNWAWEPMTKRQPGAPVFELSLPFGVELVIRNKIN